MLLIYAKGSDLEYTFGEQEKIKESLTRLFLENLENYDYEWNILILDTSTQEEIYSHFGSMYEFGKDELCASSNVSWINEVFAEALREYKKRQREYQEMCEKQDRERKHREYIRLKAEFEKEGVTK